jgi:hypothetical protein
VNSWDDDRKAVDRHQIKDQVILYYSEADELAYLGERRDYAPRIFEVIWMWEGSYDVCISHIIRPALSRG